MYADAILDPFIVWVGGTVTAAALIASVVWLFKRPMRWIWKRLISEPLAEWFDGLVHNAVSSELEPVKAEQTRIRVDLKEHMDDEDRRMGDLRQWVEDQHGEIKASLTDVKGTLAQIVEQR